MKKSKSDKIRQTVDQLQYTRETTQNDAQRDIC